jgi:GH43 family beta-xylosidase
MRADPLAHFRFAKERTMTYQNPVYPKSFPDPFVLKYCGEYWAYCTATWRDGRWFGVLRSRNLVDWEELGGALEPLPGEWPCQWAPEVSYLDGVFYLYYSLGNEATMHIRVATAAHPAGPFRDSGRILTSEPFAIDAHVFADDDGTRYLFYATDYIDHEYIGTGTARSKMIDPYTLEGPAVPVTRARHDWQVYDPNRAEKGGVRWHTIEGSFVLKHKNHYYQMFSGGNWQNVSYGVSYALADDLNTQEEWWQVADGVKVRPILQTLPGIVIGPGHNSVVRGPDNRQLFCVYHRWDVDSSARVMAIDPLDWAGDRMLLLGPSFTPQPQPNAPTLVDFFDSSSEEGLGWPWEAIGGAWQAGAGAAQQRDIEHSAEARMPLAMPHFVCEVSLRASEAALPGSSSSFGAAIKHGDADLLRVAIIPGAGRASITTSRSPRSYDFVLPETFASQAFHLLRIEVDGSLAHVALDDVLLRWQGQLDTPPTAVALQTDTLAAAFAGFAITQGWEELFLDGQIRERGWRGSGWHIRDGIITNSAEATPLTKDAPSEPYELVVNARIDQAAPDGLLGIIPAAHQHGQPLRVIIERAGQGCKLGCADLPSLEPQLLPASCDLSQFQQFRFQLREGQLFISWENYAICLIEGVSAAPSVGVFAKSATIALDMIRVTSCA